MKNVYTLLSTMSSSEKSMFSKIESKNKSKEFYRLYKILNNTSEFKKLKIKEGEFKNINYLTHKLYTRLLRAISMKSMFYSEKSDRYNSELAYCIVLKNKGLYKLALKKLNKLKSHAKSIEDFTLIVTISNLEEEICYSSFDTLYYSHVKNLLEERAFYSQQIDLISKLKYIKYKLIEIQYAESMFISRDRIEQVFGTKLEILNTPIDGLSAKAKDYILCCIQFKFLLERNDRGAIESSLKRIEHIEKNRAILKDEYFKALNNQTFGAIVFNNEAVYNNTIEKLIDYVPDTKNYAIKMFCQYHLILKWIGRKNRFIQLQKIEKSYLLFFKNYNHELNQTQIDFLFLSYVNVLLKSGMIKQAFQVLSEWRLYAIESYCIGYYYLCSIHVHLTLENLTLADSFLEALSRNKTSSAETIQIAKMIKASHKNSENLDNNLVELNKMSESNKTYYTFIQVDVISWLQNLKYKQIPT